MSSESQRLDQFDLHMAEYGERFGIRVNSPTSATEEAQRVSAHLDRQPNAKNTVQVDRTIEASLFSASAEVDSVSHQQQVLRRLFELFGTPDASSPFVMSTYLLLLSHEQRLTELLRSAEWELRDKLDGIRKLLQAQLLVLDEEVRVNVVKLQLAEAELMQLEAPRSEVVVNVSALKGDFAPFADQEGVSKLTSHIERKKSKILARIMSAQSYGEFMQLQKSKAIEGLSILVSSWRHIDLATERLS